MPKPRPKSLRSSQSYIDISDALTSHYIDAYTTPGHTPERTHRTAAITYRFTKVKRSLPRLYSIGHFPCLRKRRLRRGSVIHRVSSERFVLFATDGAIHARSRRRERRTSPMLFNTLGAWDRCTRRTPP